MDTPPPYPEGALGEYLSPLAYLKDKETGMLKPIIYTEIRLDPLRKPYSGVVAGYFWKKEDGTAGIRMDEQCRAYWEKYWL